MVNQCSRAQKFLLWLITLFNFFSLAQCRVGEAKTPGPFAAEPSPSWALGTCNPSGLLGKSVLLSGINADIVAASETHLTVVSRSMLQTSLRSHSQYSAVVTGAPMAPRTVDSNAGTYSGVAVVAKVPTRALCAAWPADLYETGRVQIVGSLVHNVWITGAVMYGYPQGKVHHNALERTISMLDFLVDHMTKVATGPRYLCGDWNFEPSQLPVTQVLHQLGWREVQDLEFQRTGQQPQPTCKRSTRKDVLWLSPELVASFQDLQIDHERFPDHSVLKARFHASDQFALRYLWPMPQPVPWDKVPELNAPASFATSDPTQVYSDLWQSKEQLAKQALGHLWQHSMAGRGQRTSPTIKKGWVAPPKKGRSVDFQPAFHGYNVQHARWLKQLRRLHNYRAWAQKHVGRTSSEDALHGIYLWKSILQAPGFGPSFPQWWMQRNTVGLGDPGVIPDHPPDAALANALCDVFQCEVNCLERRLQAAKRATRSSQHQRDANLVYKDTKRAPPEPVTSLLVTTRARVTEVDASECAVDFTPECAFDDSRPVLIHDKPVSIIHATADRLYLEDVGQAGPEQVIQQTKPLGSLPEIFSAFHEQWRQRWCKHDDVPNSRWQPIIDFARATMPHQPVQPLQITPALIRAEATAKKAHAATGLDGVSRLDLQLADDHLLSSLCSMYSRAEEAGQWPMQVTTGRVASLAKKEGAATTNEFRPITIFSLVYRIYSGLHARMLLRWCDEWTHPDVHGNRKAHSTAHLWRTIASDIQTAHDQQQALSGLTADIEKCFNCLPRWPILAAALHAGAPCSVLRAWAGALAAMTRRFKVRDSYSEGFVTSTGLAEGCALSCFGMLVLDDIMHRYIHAQYPTMRVLSFVDNWDFLTWDASAAVKQLDALLDFASMADLTVDRQKTYGWSTSAQVRTAMRHAGLPVRHQAKDLGAHVGISKQRTNRTAIERLDSLQSFWQQLKRSRAGYKTKLRALRTVAWPRGLYAIESAPISSSTWTTQRRQAVQALQFDKAGVNPMLLLGLVETAVDPEYVATLKTISEARLHCPLDFWASDLFPLANGLVNSPPSSPATVLLDRVQRMGFSVCPDGSWQDAIGTFHPGRVNFAELMNRVQWQWNKVVAHAVAHRKDFQGIQDADPTATRIMFAKHPVDDQAYLRLSLSGGLFTQDAHSHWNDQHGGCKWCGQPDSLQHRYFECPQTEELRLSLAPDVCRLRGLLPDALALRSWAIVPPTRLRWLRLLDSVPCGVTPIRGALSLRGWNEVFTDGSCFWQDSPAYRLAAWGAILAVPVNEPWLSCPVQVLGSGPLPGLCQTAYRGELYALAFVLHHAACVGARVKVYSDCLGVVNKFHLITSGRAMLKPTGANSDLWQWILESVERFGLDRVKVFKTAAHKQIFQAKSQREAWLIRHNNMVDFVAKQANLNRPQQFWQVWREHVVAVHAATFLHKQVCALHLAVAKRSTQTEAQVSLDDTPQEMPRQVRLFPTEFSTGQWDGLMPQPFAGEYGAGLAQRVMQWWIARTTGDSVGPVRWITFAHLYVDYQLTWGCPGPIQSGKHWLDPSTRRYLDPERHPFLLRCKWFKRCLKFFWKHSGHTVGLALCRGESESIQSFVPSASVPWCTVSWAGAEHWLSVEIGGSCLRGSKKLEALPIAKALPRYALMLDSPVVPGIFGA